MGVAETLVALASEKIIKITPEGNITAFDNPSKISNNVGIFGLDK